MFQDLKYPNTLRFTFRNIHVESEKRSNNQTKKKRIKENKKLFQNNYL